MDLPEVYKRQLDDAGLRALAADIEGLCQVEELKQRGGAQSYCDQGQGSFSELCEHLIRDQISGIQVLYRHDDQLWFDTVMKRGEDYRLVRMLRSET